MISFLSARRDCEGVGLMVVSGHDVPEEVAGLGVERDDVGVERGHEEPIAEDGEADCSADRTIIMFSRRDCDSRTRTPRYSGQACQR